MSQRHISARFPYLSVTIGIAGADHEVEALFDTGFDGEAIAPSEIALGEDDPDWYVTCRLGDGSQVQAPTYLGRVEIMGQRFDDVAIVMMGDEPIIGRQLMSHFRITLDHGRRLIIER